MSDGRATVWKDNDGRLRLDYTDASGKRKRIRLPIGTTRAQANALLLQRVGKVTDARILGLPSEDQLKPVTFEKFVDEEYMTAQAPPVRRQSTHDRDKLLYLNVKEAFGPKYLRAITTADIEKYISKRKVEKTCRGTPPSAAQLNRERQFVSSVLGMAKRWGLVDRNIVEDVKKLREDNAKDRVLSRDEETAILDQLQEHLRQIAIVAVNTGMRLGEVLALKWSEIDRNDGEAVVGGFIRIGAESKGHKARHVPINAAVKAVLDAQKPVATDDGFVPYVFVSRFKRALSVRWLSNAFAAAAKRANVDGVSFHTLRHTAVSRMVAAGIPDRIIMKIVGHTTAAMVSRYSHLAPSSLQGATECLSGAILGTPMAQAAGGN